MHWHINKLMINLSNNFIYIPLAQSSCKQIRILDIYYMRSRYILLACLNPISYIHNKLGLNTQLTYIYCVLPLPHPPHTIMLSASCQRFFTQSSHIIWNGNKHSIQKEMELGTPVLESSTKISKFHATTDSDLNTIFIIKREFKIGYPYDSNWDYPDWEPDFIATDWEPV